MVGGRAPRGRRGQAMVEFALGALFFMLLALGIIEFAILYHMRLVLAHASREGARYAAARLTTSPYTSVSYSEAQVREFIIGRAGTLNPPLVDADITFTPVDPEQRLPNTNIGVAIAYNVRASLPLIAPLLPAQMTFSVSSKARLE